MLTYYVGIIDMPLTVCEAVALGRSIELRNDANIANSTIQADTIITARASSSPLTYYVIMVQGMSFFMINTIVGFLIKHIGKTIMLSKSTENITCKHPNLNSFCYILKHRCFQTYVTHLNK